MEEIYRITINNHAFRFDCRSWGTRSGFAHSATLISGTWERLAVGKCYYLNRTWECYTFQSAMLEAINNAMNSHREKVTCKVKRENGWEKITAKRREALDNVLAEDEYMATLEALYDEVKKVHPAWERWEWVRVQ